MFAGTLFHQPTFALLNLANIPFEGADALADQASVRFKLRLAWAARADSDTAASATGNPFQVSPHAREARVGVFHLGQLDLKLRLARPREAKLQVELAQME